MLRALSISRRILPRQVRVADRNGWACGVHVVAPATDFGRPACAGSVCPSAARAGLLVGRRYETWPLG